MSGDDLGVPEWWPFTMPTGASFSPEAIAALRELVKDGHIKKGCPWQRIGSAPKDEKQRERLLGFCPGVGAVIMRYDGFPAASGGFEYRGDDGNGYVMWCPFPATHWMPLSAPSD